MSVQQTGMAMLLKQMGFDPEQIKQVLTAARDEIMSQVSELKESQKRIEASQNRIELLLTNIYSGDVQGTLDGGLPKMPEGVKVNGGIG